MEKQLKSDHEVYSELLGADLASTKQFGLIDGTVVSSVKIPKLTLNRAMIVGSERKIFVIHNSNGSEEWVLWTINRSSYDTVSVQQTPPGEKFPKDILYEPWMSHWPPVAILTQRMVAGEDLGLQFFSGKKHLLIRVNPFFDKESAFFN